MDFINTSSTKISGTYAYLSVVNVLRSNGFTSDLAPHRASGYVYSGGLAETVYAVYLNDASIYSLSVGMSGGIHKIKLEEMSTTVSDMIDV